MISPGWRLKVSFILFWFSPFYFLLCSLLEVAQIDKVIIVAKWWKSGWSQLECCRMVDTWLCAIKQRRQKWKKKTKNEEKWQTKIANCHNNVLLVSVSSASETYGRLSHVGWKIWFRYNYNIYLLTFNRIFMVELKKKPIYKNNLGNDRKYLKRCFILFKHYNTKR